MSSTNEFVTVAFEEDQYCRTKKGLAQWDREKTLRVYGISTDDNVQIHFSLAENYGEAVSVEAAISNGAIEASIPPFIFEKKTSSSQKVYYAYAFIYLLNGESAETVRKIIFEIETRPKPEDYPPNDPEGLKTWNKKVNLPLDEDGNPDNGTADQMLMSNGDGTTKWGNPKKLTIQQGNSKIEYDGSGAVTIIIPTSDGESVTERIEKLSTDTEVTIDPNKFYVFPEMEALSITLGEATDTSVVNEYHFVFQSGATATTLSLPDTIKVPDRFTVEENKVYEISILENCLAYQSWAVS